MIVNIAAIQMDVVIGAQERNLQRAEELMLAAVESGAEVLVLPEVFATGFDFTHLTELAQDEQGEIITRLRRFAGRQRVMIVGGSMLERRGDQFYNTMFIINQQGEVVNKYSKGHLFTSGLTENKYITVGSGLSPFLYRRGTDTARMNGVICFDLKFEICRNAGLAGTQILCVAAYWPARRRDQFVLISRARAYENNYYVVAANATNLGHHFSSCGNSLIVSPMGDIIDAAGNEECFLLTAADTEFPQKNGMVNFTALRRPLVDDVRGLTEEQREGLWR